MHIRKHFLSEIYNISSPSGYTCDVADGRCNKGDVSVPFYKKTSAKPVKEQMPSVICPDQSSQCPDGSTCCKLASGQYGW